MTELYIFDELSKTSQLTVATIIADFCTGTANTSRIAPVTIEEIMETEWAYVAVTDESFAGYVRFKQEIVHEKTLQTYRPIGTLVVAKAFHGNGIGAELVKTITSDALAGAATPFAYCNPLSLRSFQTAGYVEALPEELPAVATSAHNNQPMVFPTRSG